MSKPLNDNALHRHPMSLTNEAWGGFDAMPAESPLGPEKRLELDLRAATAKQQIVKDNKDDKKGMSPQKCDSTFVKMVDDVAVALNVGAFTSRKQVDDCTVAVFAAGASVVGIKNRIVITTSSRVSMHAVFASIVACVQAAGLEVEWASYMRKNNVCPWDDNNNKAGGDMALEYLALKSCFPAGNPYIFGPVDADHYFYYVSDTVDRSAKAAPVVEADCQINLKMYGCSSTFSCPEQAQKLLESSVTDIGDALAMETVKTPSNGSDYSGSERSGSEFPSDAAGTPASPAKLAHDTAVFQGCVFSNAETYHLLRTTDDELGNVASFETNEELTDCRGKLKQMIERVQPNRFTVMVLVDPQSKTGAELCESHSLKGLEKEDFPAFNLVNRAVNEFAPGYKVVKLSYLKSS